MEIIKEVNNSKRNNIRGVVTHKVDGYECADKIELPVLFGLTEGGKRLYDRETMTDYLNDILDNLDRHEELYH